MIKAKVIGSPERPAHQALRPLPMSRLQREPISQTKIKDFIPEVGYQVILVLSPEVQQEELPLAPGSL